ncbi:MAG: hypothetical protein R2710_00350 [Acidimicrobiales bacterium]
MALRRTHLIDASSHPSIGENIQGPSMIRVPAWVEDRLGAIYLYFADHKGSYIRLAYADDPAGPWTVYAPGSLHLADSGFPVTPPTATDEQMAAIEARYARLGLLHDVRTEVTTPHIASPDVHIRGRQFVMYFHGLEGLARQVTRRAVSHNGIDFVAEPATLERTYLRVFDVDGATYGLAMPGQLYRLPEGRIDIAEVGPMLFEPDMRHCAVRVVPGAVEVFWTRVGDAPERILRSVIDTTVPWTQWREGPATEVIRPVEAWEGADEPVEPSRRSVAYGLVNQLRDPAVFEDLLLYAFGGESGIALLH